MNPLRPARPPHWIVRAHWLMRSVSFANSFAFVAVFLAGQGYAAWVWALLAGQFLVYPHLVYWRACRSDDSLRTELRFLVLDCFLVGIWVAAIGFPLWITFTLFISTAVNNAISRGNHGILLALAAFTGGALIGVELGGFRVVPEPGGWVTGLCVFGLVWYLLGIGKVAHARARALRVVRENLKQRERELQQANDSLRLQLAENLALQHRLEEQANRDPLTGLFNRRYLVDTFERELARCTREELPLCLMLIDIDHFKRVNDRYGHPVGDLVLQELARLLAAEARAEDVACRFGGEEFVMLLPGLPQAPAVERAEHWRRSFTRLEVTMDGRPIDLSLSVGIALFPAHGRSQGDLLRHADLALYQAKAGGRNRVVVYDPAIMANRRAVLVGKK